jgi:predicted TIM-barrel fold metal-dependent hydrolase
MRESTEAMDRVEVVDADGHITEPGDLWERYIDPKYRDSCPKIFIERDGAERFRIDEHLTVQSEVRHRKPSIATASLFGGRDGDLQPDLTYYDGEAGGFDPHERIKWMNREGFDRAVLFPSLTINLIWHTMDPKRAAAVTDAYNRYVLDFMSPYKGRLLGVAILPMIAVDEAIAQAKTFKKAGINAGCVRPNPVAGKALHHPCFYPLWEACQEMDFGIAIHGASGVENMGTERFGSVRTGEQGSSGAPYSYAVEHCFTHTAEMMAAVTSFVLGGVCDKFPRLKVAFIEAGGAWLPGYVDRMDRHFDDVSANDLHITHRPSEIFQRQCFSTFEPVESSIRVLAEHFGPHKLMVSTDYPHGDGFPNTINLIKQMKLKPEVERALFSVGAKKWYGIDDDSVAGRPAPEPVQG